MERLVWKNLAKKAKNLGYQINFSSDLESHAEIGFYCQDKKFKINANFSIVSIHGMDQGRDFWPNSWKNNPWSEFDIGLLPGKFWVERWNESSWDPCANPKIGVYETGWPKSDIIFSDEFEKEVNLFRAKYKIFHKKNIIYAPTFETDEKQLDVLNFAKKTNSNLLIKHAVSESMKNKYPDIYENIISMNNICKKKYPESTIILDAEDDIMHCLSVSDILITDESSVLYEALLFNIPTIVPIDWKMRTNNISQSRDIRPSKYAYKIDYKKNIPDLINKIYENIDDIKNNLKEEKNKHFSTIGLASQNIITILSEFNEKNECALFKIKNQKKIIYNVVYYRIVIQFFLKLSRITNLKFLKLNKIGFIKKIYLKIKNL
tara:strand:- start:57 stop:1184 length:1128 start_codon:yes stop_codon:yes gene_type:complete